MTIRIPEMTPNMRSNRYKPGLHRFTLLTAFLTWILICAGGLVTGTESGLSVPDWPLSYGQLFPPMVGGIRFEHSHRMIAGVVLIFMLILTTWVLRQEKRRWVKKLAILAFGLVILQAALGGLTVIFLLPPALSTLHALIAQTYFALMIMLSVATSRQWINDTFQLTNTKDRRQVSTLNRFSFIILVCVYIQLFMGALKRHNVISIFPHMIFASFVFVSVSVAFYFTVFKLPREQTFRNIRWVGVMMFTLVSFEMPLGIASWLARLKDPRVIGPAFSTVIWTTAHVALGALILACAGGFFILTLRIRRRISNWQLE